MLGRTKKAKLAFAVGSLVAGKKMNLGPRAIADLVNQQLKNNPQFKEIGDQLRQDLRGVGTAASGAMVERQMDALAGRLHGRTADVRDRLSGVVPGTGSAEPEEHEDEEPRQDTEDEAEEAEDRDDREASAEDEAEEAEDRDDREASAEDESEPPRKRAAKKAPAKKAVANKAPAKKAPAKKAAQKTQSAARKTAAKKTAAAGDASRFRRSKGGDEG